MPGPTPKHPSTRARRNVSATKSTLSAEHDVKAPSLPRGIQWHTLTKRWWSDLWDSPMAPEYLDMDVNGLFRVAMLLNDFWNAPDAKSRQDAQTRLEKVDVDYGTNPMARRRLEWQIETTEDSKRKGRTRRGETPTETPEQTDDPRARRLRAVN